MHNLLNEDITMSDLGNAMKVALADTFVMMTQTWGFHVNVEGPHTYTYHKMFGKIYTELFEASDRIAEQIRGLDEYAPGSLKRFQDLTTLEEDVKIPLAHVMVERALASNLKVIVSLNQALEQAKIVNNEGVINLLGERLDVHAKWGWFLRATSKKDRA
jgi:starvation-inducible DNA-binding protein